MIHIVQNKIFSSNTYILSDSYNRYCLLIDPGLNEEFIEDKLKYLNQTPIGIIATHGHFDHIASAAFFQEKYNIPFYLHKKDYKISQSANFFLKIVRIKHKIVTPKPDVLIDKKIDNLSIGDFNLKVYNYPGHSEGGIIVEYYKQLFTGDLFYKSGLGFNGFPGENKSILRKSIIEIFENFSDDHVFFPGHGEFETIGFVKEKNSELLDFLYSNKLTHE